MLKLQTNKQTRAKVFSGIMMVTLTLRKQLLPWRGGGGARGYGTVVIDSCGSATRGDGGEGRRGGQAGQDWGEGAPLLHSSTHTGRKLGEKGGRGGWAGRGAPGPMVWVVWVMGRVPSCRWGVGKCSVSHCVSHYHLSHHSTTITTFLTVPMNLYTSFQP